MEKLNPKIAKRKAAKVPIFITIQVQTKWNYNLIHLRYTFLIQKKNLSSTAPLIVENILNVILQDTSSGMTESKN